MERGDTLYNTHNWKLGLVELAFDPDAKLDREPLREAAKFKIALEILQEFAGADKIHYQLHFEQ